jgi:hypothetical protein
MLRDRASETDKADGRRVLLTLADDCDQMAADLDGSLESRNTHEGAPDASPGHPALCYPVCG